MSKLQYLHKVGVYSYIENGVCLYITKQQIVSLRDFTIEYQAMLGKNNILKVDIPDFIDINEPIIIDDRRFIVTKFDEQENAFVVEKITTQQRQNMFQKKNYGWIMKDE